MTLSLGTTARNAGCDAIVDLLDVGGPGTIEVYTGAKPATPGTAASGTLLATLTLSATAFGSAATGAATIGAVNPATAAATGTAGWFRAKSGAGVAIFDGTVDTSAADLNLNSTAITAGGAVSITGGVVTMPG